MTQERLRIARELHDTLAHALVAINVRAGVAAHLGAREDGTQALTEIKHVSAEALHDLRATLDVLRDPDAPAPTLPELDLNGVPQLIARARAAGLDAATELELSGAPIPIAARPSIADDGANRDDRRRTADRSHRRRVRRKQENRSGSGTRPSRNDRTSSHSRRERERGADGRERLARASDAPAEARVSASIRVLVAEDQPICEEVSRR